MSSVIKNDEIVELDELISDVKEFDEFSNSDTQEEAEYFHELLENIYPLLEKFKENK